MMGSYEDLFKPDKVKSAGPKFHRKITIRVSDSRIKKTIELDIDLETLKDDELRAVCQSRLDQILTSLNIPANVT